MPIDYSKFDKIDCDDEEDDRKARNDGFTEILQQCMHQLGEKQAAEDSAFAGLRPGALPPPVSSSIPPDDFDIGAPPLDFPGDFGSSADLGRGSQGLEFDKLRSEAWQLLLSRLVVRPGAANISRVLLLEAELHVLAGRYRQALLAALALSLATGSDDTQANAKAASGVATVSGVAIGLHSAGSPPEEWVAPALVIEMVAAYQLGDRDHAVAVRDRLKEMSRDSLSQHLRKRFEGTSEILDLVPQFLNYLKAAEQEDTSPTRDAPKEATAGRNPRRRR